MVFIVLHDGLGNTINTDEALVCTHSINPMHWMHSKAWRKKQQHRTILLGAFSIYSSTKCDKKFLPTTNTKTAPPATAMETCETIC